MIWNSSMAWCSPKWRAALFCLFVDFFRWGDQVFSFLYYVKVFFLLIFHVLWKPIYYTIMVFMRIWVIYELYIRSHRGPYRKMLVSFPRCQPALCTNMFWCVPGPRGFTLVVHAIISKIYSCVLHWRFSLYSPGQVKQTDTSFIPRSNPRRLSPLLSLCVKCLKLQLLNLHQPPKLQLYRYCRFKIAL